MKSILKPVISILFYVILTKGTNLKSPESYAKHLNQNNSSWIPLGTYNNKTFYTDLSFGLSYATNTFDLCHRSGLSAALIESPEENAYVANFLGEAVPNYQYFWIAATDLFHEGIWTSFKTANVLGFTNWHNETANNDLNNCIYFIKTGEWIQTSCSADTNRPLCEQVA